ncbi:tripartite tricarboxylate transporter TctB family protein, partial [Escherichia coli]
MLLSIAYGYYATKIPGYPGDEYEPFTASTLPYALAGLGALFSLLLVLSPGGEPLRRESGDWRRVFILLGLMVIYGLGLTWFGFVLSTIAFLT